MRGQSFHFRATTNRLVLRLPNARLKLLGFCDVGLAAFLVAFFNFATPRLLNARAFLGSSLMGLIVILHGAIQFALGTKFSTAIGIKYRQDIALVFFRRDRAAAGADCRIADAVLHVSLSSAFAGPQSAAKTATDRTLASNIEPRS